MYQIYATHEDCNLLVKVGHKVCKLEKALERAKKLRAKLAEIRDDTCPHSRSLRAIVKNGVAICSP